MFTALGLKTMIVVVLPSRERSYILPDMKAVLVWLINLDGCRVIKTRY